jgi:hypothetical protein
MKSIPEMADVVEMWIWGDGVPMTIGALKDHIEASVEETELDSIDQDDAENEWAEDMAQEIMDEIAGRRALLGERYPFAVEGYRVLLREADPANSPYLFCAALSTFPSAEIENQQRELQFENLAMSAAGNFFNGQTLRIGASWRTEAINTYEDLLEKVRELIPYLGESNGTANPGGGDAGWDFIVVKGFRDRVFPHLVAFGNCATGRSNWLSKGVEAQIGLFFSYFEGDGLSRSTILELFAVPFGMDEKDILRKHGPRTITFDRYRICENATDIEADAGLWLAENTQTASSISLV